MAKVSFKNIRPNSPELEELFMPIGSREKLKKDIFDLLTNYQLNKKPGNYFNLVTSFATISIVLDNKKIGFKSEQINQMLSEFEFSIFNLFLLYEYTFNNFYDIFKGVMKNSFPEMYEDHTEL